MTEWVLVLILTFNGTNGASNSMTSIGLPTESVCRTLGKQWLEQHTTKKGKSFFGMEAISYVRDGARYHCLSSRGK